MKKINLLPWELQTFADGEEQAQADDTQENQDVSGAQDTDDTQDDSENESGKQFTQEDVDRLVAERVAREQKKAEKQRQEAARLAGMNAQERETERLKQLEKRLADFEKKDAVNAMSKEVSNMLRETKIPIRDSVVAGLVREDADSTKEAAQDFISMVEEIKKDLLKDKYTGKSPKVNTSPALAKDEWTKEKIMKIKDNVKRQALIASHPDLFGLNK